MRMMLGFYDADELRARHAVFRRRHAIDRAETAQAVDSGQRAINASWTTLARSQTMAEHADRFGREREIHALVDDLVAQERHLLDMNDDGAILAAIFPRRPQNAR